MFAVAFLIVTFFAGRLWAFMEMGFRREPVRIVPEVNPGVAIVRVESADDDRLEGSVEGFPVRFFAGDEVVEARPGQDFSLQVFP